MDNARVTIKITPARYPLSVEIKYARILRAVINDIQAFAMDEIWREGPAMIAAADRDYGRQDAIVHFIPAMQSFVFLLTSMLDRIGRGITSSLLGALDRVAEIRNATDIANRKEWSRQLREAYTRELGVNILNQEPDLSRMLAGWEQNNLAMIKTIPPNTVERMRSKMTEAFTRGTSMKELSSIVQEATDVSRSRANLIARDQVAKLNGQLAEQRHRAAGLDEYIWRTMRDERVRPKHRALDGKTRKWSEGIKPGEEIQCRCVPEPVFPAMKLD